MLLRAFRLAVTNLHWCSAAVRHRCELNPKRFTLDRLSPWRSSSQVATRRPRRVRIAIKAYRTINCSKNLSELQEALWFLRVKDRADGFGFGMDRWMEGDGDSRHRPNLPSLIPATSLQMVPVVSVCVLMLRQTHEASVSPRAACQSKATTTLRPMPATEPGATSCGPALSFTEAEALTPTAHPSWHSLSISWRPWGPFGHYSGAWC